MRKIFSEKFTEVEFLKIKYSEDRFWYLLIFINFNISILVSLHQTTKLIFQMIFLINCILITNVLGITIFGLT